MMEAPTSTTLPLPHLLHWLFLPRLLFSAIPSSVKHQQYPTPETKLKLTPVKGVTSSYYLNGPLNIYEDGRSIISLSSTPAKLLASLRVG